MIPRTAFKMVLECSRNQMRDHLHRLGVLLVGVRPAGDLVQVRTDPRQLAGALPFQLGSSPRLPGPRP